jgi:hypothetical protein
MRRLLVREAQVVLRRAVRAGPGLCLACGRLAPQTFHDTQQ